MRLFKNLSFGLAMLISTLLLIAAFILFFSYSGCAAGDKPTKIIEDKTVLAPEPAK